MARYIILPSRLLKNTCRHSEIYYLDKWTSQKNYVVMARYIILPSRLPKNYKSTWRHKLSYQVDLTKQLCRHGEIYYLTKST